MRIAKVARLLGTLATATAIAAATMTTGCPEEAPPPRMPATVYAPWLVAHKKRPAAASSDEAPQPEASASPATSAESEVVDAGGDGAR